MSHERGLCSIRGHGAGSRQLVARGVRDGRLGLQMLMWTAQSSKGSRSYLVLRQKNQHAQSRYDWLKEDAKDETPGTKEKVSLRHT